MYHLANYELPRENKYCVVLVKNRLGEWESLGICQYYDKSFWNMVNGGSIKLSYNLNRIKWYYPVKTYNNMGMNNLREALETVEDTLEKLAEFYDPKLDDLCEHLENECTTFRVDLQIEEAKALNKWK